MIVYGKPIAESILLNLKETIEVEKLTPHLVVILAGTDQTSRVYIKYKAIAAEKAGIQLTLLEFSEKDNTKTIKKIHELNNDPNVHGIIVQLPLFSSWNGDAMVNLVAPQKDVDGFIADSLYQPATALGVWEMLKEFARIEGFGTAEKFLKDKKIVVLGKGRTAGKPTRELLTQKGFSSALIDSKTENPNDIIRDADIVITATGKKHIINADNLKDGSYVIGVGVGKETIDGKQKTFGDINEDEIKDIAKLYCPTIGGIGPLTIACLLRNVVESAQRSSQ